MASHRHHFHPNHCQHQAPPPSSTHCCCNPSYSCCSPPHHPSTPPPPPPPPPDQIVQAITSLLCQSDPFPTHLYTQCPKFQTHEFLSQNQYQKHHPRHRSHQHQQQQQQQTHSTIAALLCRIEALESSIHHFSSPSYQSSCSLRDTAARIIQTHYRSFLVRRSRTLRHLKDLAFIKTGFNALKSSFSNESHLDFLAFSHKAMDLLLELDSIEDGDPMVTDGKRSISRDLVQFLDSIEGVAVKQRCRYVKAVKNTRFGQNFNKSRALDSRYGKSSDDRRKLLQNLRGRVEKISRLCKVSANDDEDSEPEGIHHVGDDDGDRNVLISTGNGVSPAKNEILVRRQRVQPRVKKSVSFAEDGNISKVYSSTYEPALSGDVTCLDGSSSSDDQGELLGNSSCEVMDSSQGAEDDAEALVDNGGSPHSSDGERKSKRDLKNDGRSKVKGQLQAQKEKLLFSAPLPLKMENRTDLMKSKGVRIVT